MSNAINPKSHLPSLAFLVEGAEVKTEYRITHVEVYKALNKIPTAKVVLVDGRPDISDTQKFQISEKETKFEPGKAVEIKMGYDNKEKTVFKGIITGHGLKVRSSGEPELILKCSDKAIKMTLNRKNKYFKDKKDSEIITSIISDSGATAEVKATTEKHKKVIRYFCTDWDFVLSRAEVIGAIVAVDDGKVVVKPPDLAKGPVATLTYGMDIIKFDGEMDARYQLDSIESTSWDMKTQKILKSTSAEPSVNAQGNITGKKLSKVVAKGKGGLQSTAPITKSMLKIWADAQMLKSRMSRLRGKATFLGTEKVKPNTIIEFKNLSGRLNGKAYVSEITHIFEAGEWTTEATFGVSPKWFVDDTPNVMAASTSGLLPGIEGLQHGKVKKIDADPDGETRVLVDIPIIEESGIGVWARLSNLYATKEAGTFFMPEVGDEVILGFFNNDPRFPVILGKLYSSHADHKPPYTPDKKNTYKAIVTKNKLVLEFNDEDKVITLKTPGKHEIVISDKDKKISITSTNKNKMIFDDDGKKITIEDENKNKIEMSKSGISIDSPKDLKITAKGNINIESKKAINIKSSNDTKIKAGGSATLEASSTATVKGGTVNCKASGFLTVEGKMTTVKASGITKVSGKLVKIN
ncbi:MAG: type VI secretion system tip protein VgrG [Chitinophagales bacterium]